MARSVALLVLFALSAPRAEGARLGANPIRKVVALLQDLQSKVAEEGKKEQVLFDKFMCYCKTSGGALDSSMAEAKSKIESLEAALAGAGEKKAQTEQDLKDHQKARSDAKEAIAQATALRETEAAAFAALAADNAANIGALGKAVSVLGKGAAGGFLQTGAAKAVRRFAMEKAELPDGAREAVLSFLAGSQQDAYAPQSGQISGILKQLLDTLQGDDEEAAGTEAAAIESFKALIAAKKKEVEALTSQIEDEQLRIGELGVLLATGANDLEATKKSLAADAQFQLELASTCSTKEAEWEEVKKTRAEELAAIADTIKVLNDDEALDTFSKALPKPSFLQVEVAAADVKARALEAVRSVPLAPAGARLSARPELDLIELALSGKKVGFEKVLALIGDLVSNLHREQGVDDEKKEFCAAQLDASEDKQKELEHSVSDSAAAIEEIEGSIAQLKEEIQALSDGIEALDKSVGDATAQRQAEHEDFVEETSNNKAAKDLLLWAKNRLNKFYNPKLYKEEKPAMLLQITELRAAAHHGEQPPPPPEAPGAYSKKSEESSGVIALIDSLVAGLDHETQTAEVDEKNAQTSYEKLTAEASQKRAADSSAISEKEAAVAAQEEALQAEKDKKTGAETELAATLEYIRSLHGECDWLVQYYDTRKEARTGEIEALEKAKAVLNGASYSLLQTGARAAGARAFLARA